MKNFGGNFEHLCQIDLSDWNFNKFDKSLNDYYNYLITCGCLKIYQNARLHTSCVIQAVRFRIGT